MPECVILNDELRRDRCAIAQREGAARFNSSSVNVRTAAAASRLLRRRSSRAASFVMSACSRAFLSFNSATTSQVTR